MLDARSLPSFADGRGYESQGVESEVTNAFERNAAKPFTVAAIKRGIGTAVRIRPLVKVQETPQCL